MVVSPVKTTSRRLYVPPSGSVSIVSTGVTAVMLDSTSLAPSPSPKVKSRLVADENRMPDAGPCQFSPEGPIVALSPPAALSPMRTLPVPVAPARLMPMLVPTSDALSRSKSFAVTAPLSVAPDRSRPVVAST